uniref:RNA polymerase II subunit A C-terminal domain phosphatase n=1 Tax=Kwoniella bestiolae CBS 10118 TaxID=1296100 RepID=A0A1B9FX01_9TREE|nr:hypothetical protein I302_07642 [Kwoniella bestiolae CBS 10118]OCF23288.1 hypothetical protein I302_07642 [Kwoniella bestiolae CBS 10118]
MSDPPTQLSLPPTLPYPITITRFLVSTGNQVKRGSPLLEYSFMSKEQCEAIVKREKEGKKADISKGEIEGDDGSGTWDCLIDGEVAGWEGSVKVGMKIERRQSSQPLLNVHQPCSHPVQLHGMCGICGADLTDSSSQAGPSRHPGGFEVTHDSMGVTVSKNEAHRLDNLTRDALLSSRKLSLIVDLDQTIIHTTVDPTVAEWMDEIDQYDRQSESPEQRSTTPPLPPDTTEKGTIEESTTPPTSPHTASLTLPQLTPSLPREKNPNAEALKDVARFQIADDLPPGYVKPKSRGGIERMVEMQGRWYFTKPRPGLQNFLDTMSELYEMHVYTMGTRSYADAICNVIDPDGRIFGGRILSRDESGSFSSKNLKRLFPTDTSMVVVIDDRSDVWADCPNLVKVVPYDFFIGIGDINSSFLPKNKSTPPPSSTATSPSNASSPASSSDLSTPPPTTPEDVPSVEDGLLLKAKLLDDLSESRPLAKMQEELEHDQPPGIEEKTEREVNKSDNAGNDQSATSAKQNQAERRDDKTIIPPTPTPASPSTPPKARKPLLNPEDYELLRVSAILTDVHRRFYRAFDSLENWDPKTSLPMSCDVEFIIPEMKSTVLEGCNLVFSGLIPQAVNPETTEIWQTAETFGALCSLSVHPRITHCVTATLNTEKTYRSSKIPDVKIVWANWFWDSIALWHRQDENKYLAEKKPEQRSGSRPVTPLPILNGNNGESSTSQLDDKGVDTKENQEDGKEDEHEDMDDDAQVGKGWDEGADAEWEAFMAEDDDDEFGTENGSVRSANSAPSTPSKKRVRYADEESLPLEDFKDPSPTDPDDQPAKRRKPLLLEAPSGNDQIPDENRFQYKGKGKITDLSEQNIAGEEGHKDADEHSLAGTEGTEGTEQDEFALMLMDSLADGGEAEGDE